MSENKTQLSAEDDFGPEIKQSAKAKFKFTPKDKEKHLYHAKLEKPLHDAKTGKKLSKPFVQTFTRTEWKQFKDNTASHGYSFEVLWDPTSNQ